MPHPNQIGVKSGDNLLLVGLGARFIESPIARAGPAFYALCAAVRVLCHAAAH